MSITVLYVYSPTTFKTDVKIESMAGQLFNSGLVDLAPGVYRLDGAGKAAPTSRTNGAIGDHQILEHNIVVAADGTKTSYPDPPLRAAEQLGQYQIKAFLQGQGEEIRF
jgi:hypothetical protein